MCGVYCPLNEKPGRRHRKELVPCGWHPQGSSGPAPRCGWRCPPQTRIWGRRTGPAFHTTLSQTKAPLGTVHNATTQQGLAWYCDYRLLSSCFNITLFQGSDRWLRYMPFLDDYLNLQSGTEVSLLKSCSCSTHAERGFDADSTIRCKREQCIPQFQKWWCKVSFNRYISEKGRDSCFF